MGARRRPLPGNFRAEALRQAREAQRLRGMLGAMGEKIALWAAWMSRDDVWDRVRAACGPVRFGALAERVGLDPNASAARDVFLEALSTVGTRDMAWDLALRFSAGADHETFLRIWRAEEDVNALALQIFHGATHLYRGGSTAEAFGAHDETVGPACDYSFVSLSANPAVAVKFAFINYAVRSGNTVVVVIDAHRARKAGVVPAIYTLASEVLDLSPSEEDASRTFPMGNAGEVQAHFPAIWPPGSDKAMVAIITVFPLTPGERRKLESTGLPTLHCLDIFPSGEHRDNLDTPLNNHV